VSGYLPWLVPLAVALPAGLILALNRRRHLLAVPLADADALERPARRTAAIRVALVLCLVALLALAVSLVRRPAEPLAGLLSRESSTVVVLDVSASVSDLVYREIARTLQEIVSTAGDEQRVGLVLFSDVAVEALPPGTRAVELAPFIRYFLPRQDPGARLKPTVYRGGGPGSPPEIAYPLSPWFRRFSGGTRISTGLAAARHALERDAGGAGTILLLSDLEEANEDVPRLTTELAAYARNPELSLNIVGLPPATEAKTALFERILGGRETVVESAELALPRSAGAPAGSLPIWFVVVCGLVGVLLAANELFANPLAWRRPAQGAAG
jgi:hypothetical protein